MTGDYGDGLAQPEASNSEFLAAALHWLRLRLAWYAAGAAGGRHAGRPRAWGTVRIRTRPARPARPAHSARGGAAASQPAGPLSAVPQCSPPRRWLRCHRSARAQANSWPRRRRPWSAAENSSPPPELVRLGQVLGLSAFERQMLLLCAAMELDPRIGALCAQAQNDPAQPIRRSRWR